MARIGSRRYTTRELGTVFRALDAGATRSDVRDIIRTLQGRGIGNDAIRDLRATYVQLRRSDGFDRRIRGGRRTLPPPQSLPVGVRPSPPVIPGVDIRTTQPFTTAQGVRVGVFTVNDLEASLAEQIAAQSKRGGFGSPFAPLRSATDLPGPYSRRSPSPGRPVGGPLRNRIPTELEARQPR